MKNDIKSVHIEILGAIKEFETKKIQDVLNSTSNTENSVQNTENLTSIEVKGESSNIWSIIKDIANTQFNSDIEQIMFYFKEPAKTS